VTGGPPGPGTGRARGGRTGTGGRVRARLDGGAGAAVTPGDPGSGAGAGGSEVGAEVGGPGCALTAAAVPTRNAAAVTATASAIRRVVIMGAPLRVSARVRPGRRR
jgi:hypothetical protein